MKTALAFALAFGPVTIAQASMTCTAAYATDQQIVNHVPVETKLKALKLDASQAISGTDREILINQFGSGLVMSLSANGTLLGSSKLSRYVSGTEVTLDVPNSQFDEYVRISCR